MKKLDYILRYVFLVLIIAINGYIVFHSCLDAAQSTEQAAGVVEAAAEVVEIVAPGTIPDTSNPPAEFVTLIRKLFGHFGLFALDGVITMLGVYFIHRKTKFNNIYLYFIVALGVGLFFALLTETIQLFIPGRSGEFTDSMIDFGGFALAALLVFLIFFIIHLKKSKENKKQKNED